MEMMRPRHTYTEIKKAKEGRLVYEENRERQNDKEGDRKDKRKG